jgi:hypothetical protein
VTRTWRDALNHPTSDDDRLRVAALDAASKLWGFETFRSYATYDLDNKGLMGSRAIFDIVSAALGGAHPEIEALRERVAYLESVLGAETARALPSFPMPDVTRDGDGKPFLVVDVTDEYTGPLVKVTSCDGGSEGALMDYRSFGETFTAWPPIGPDDERWADGVVGPPHRVSCHIHTGESPVWCTCDMREVIGPMMVHALGAREGGR